MSATVISEDPRAQAHYERCLRAGTSPRLAEMFALAAPPGLKGTDSAFLEGHANGSQFERTPEMGDYYAGAARRRGVNPKGKVYLSGLAEYPGDPRAWVGGRGDVRRVLEERGWAGRGAVDVKAAPALGPPERVPVAPDLVDEAVAREVAADPGLAEMDAGELRHEVAEKLKPHWHRKGA